jgi:hypothetical protein
MPREHYDGRFQIIATSSARQFAGDEGARVDEQFTEASNMGAKTPNIVILFLGNSLAQAQGQICFASRSPSI